MEGMDLDQNCCIAAPAVSTILRSWWESESGAAQVSQKKAEERPRGATTCGRLGWPHQSNQGYPRPANESGQQAARTNTPTC